MKSVFHISLFDTVVNYLLRWLSLQGHYKTCVYICIHVAKRTLIFNIIIHRNSGGLDAIPRGVSFSTLYRKSTMQLNHDAWILKERSKTKCKVKSAIKKSITEPFIIAELSCFDHIVHRFEHKNAVHPGWFRWCMATDDQLRIEMTQRSERGAACCCVRWASVAVRLTKSLSKHSVLRKSLALGLFSVLKRTAPFWNHCVRR